MEGIKINSIEWLKSPKGNDTNLISFQERNKIFQDFMTWFFQSVVMVLIKVSDFHSITFSIKSLDKFLRY
jgi:hypothetical protein